jgi:hypothetical protein
MLRDIKNVKQGVEKVHMCFLLSCGWFIITWLDAWSFISNVCLFFLFLV